MQDNAYSDIGFSRTELQHEYGDSVHILSDPFSLQRLSRLCSPGTIQPEVCFLVRELYRDLLRDVMNLEFPRVHIRTDTRMKEYTERGQFTGSVLDPDTRVTTVDVARAGILPSQVCFETLSAVLSPGAVRQDHLMMSRTLDADEHVTGAGIGGIKLAGPADGRIILFPDPMGATGSSLSTAIQFYKDQKTGSPARILTMNLIITPEYIRRIQSDHPDVTIYAVRLDRGLSSEEVLNSIPGSRWDEERGLTDNHYIVPGGGGFGEVLNNALE